jgi:hypothetical protein
MITQTRNLLAEDLDKEQAWTTKTEPVVTFVCDSGKVVGFPLFHLAIAQYDPDQHVLMLRFSSGVVIIQGAGALAFYKDFAKGKATWIGTNHEEILSVTFEAAERS